MGLGPTGLCMSIVLFVLKLKLAMTQKKRTQPRLGFSNCFKCMQTWKKPVSHVSYLLTKLVLFLLQSNVVPIENWVLCRIFLKKRGSKNEDDQAQSGNERQHMVRRPKSPRPVFYDFMRKDRANLNFVPSSSTSGSSGITEVSSNESDDHEESSSCNNFPKFRKNGSK